MPRGIANSAQRAKPRPKSNTWKSWLDASFEIETDECILFPGATNGNGYGMINHQDTGFILAHRYILIKKLGRAIAPGMETLHTCDVRSCVNKRHCSEGTHLENIRDCVRKGRNVPLPVVYGENTSQAKLTNEQVLSIRSEYIPKDIRYLDLAAKYGVTESAICAIINRRTWNHI
jgi:hypothetical protein